MDLKRRRHGRRFEAAVLGLDGSLFSEQMRILLRDKNTGMYYAHPDRWSVNAAEAFDFHCADHAMQVARSYTLSAAEVVYFFKDTYLNFSISVPPL